MITDVESFAKQLKEEGITAGKEEADKIIADAKNQAMKIITEAKAAIDQLHKDAEIDIARKYKRSEAEMKLAARDLILNVKGQIEDVIAFLLREQINGVLSSADVIKDSILELIKCDKSGQEWELVLGPTVGKALVRNAIENLFKSNSAKITLSEGFKKSGFELRNLSGNQVIEISDESVVDAFRRLLSPELQKILDSKLDDFVKGPKDQHARKDRS
jgi:vacuolar-type H+-ATPase subunit E/Vma4